MTAGRQSNRPARRPRRPPPIPAIAVTEPSPDRRRLLARAPHRRRPHGHRRRWGVPCGRAARAAGSGRQDGSRRRARHRRRRCGVRRASTAAHGSGARMACGARARVRRLYRGARRCASPAGASAAAALRAHCARLGARARPRRVRGRAAARDLRAGDGGTRRRPATRPSSPTRSHPTGLPTWLPRLALLSSWSCRRRDRRGRGPVNTRLLPARRGSAAASGGPRSARRWRRRRGGVLPGGLWDLMRGGAKHAAAGPDGPRPALRRAARRQPRSARLPRAALRRARPRCAARPRVRAAWPAERRPFFLRKPVPRRRSPIGRSLRPGWRGARPDAPCARGCARAPGRLRARAHRFPPESYWRGETHRLCDRPGALVRRAGGSRGRGRAPGDRRDLGAGVGGPHALRRAARRAARRGRRVPGRRAGGGRA